MHGKDTLQHHTQLHWSSSHSQHPTSAPSHLSSQLPFTAESVSFAAHSPHFNPQIQLEPYVHLDVSQSQSKASGSQEQGSSQNGHFRFKMPHKEAEEEDEDEEDEEEEAGQQQTGRRRSRGQVGGARTPGACDSCKLAKVRCIFPNNSGPPCRRCTHGGHECHVSSQKQKPKPPSHTELINRLRQKDHIICSLLLSGQKVSAVTNPIPDYNPPTGHASNRGGHSPNSYGASDERDAQGSDVLPTLPAWDKHTPKHEVERHVDAWIEQARRRLLGKGVSAETGTVEWESGGAKDFKEGGTDTPNPRRWYIPGDAPETPSTPEILTRRLVTYEEVDKLFEMFFDKINMFFSICDPALHTPQRVLKTSPFLYTAICAVASRHYSLRPELYPLLLESAKRAAGAALNQVKSIETCQAYLLLGVYHPPPRTFEEDRTFLYLGLAIRVAIDLELHLPSPGHLLEEARTEERERELLNRARVWLNCLCNDRSISTQLGKPSAIHIPAHKAIPFDLNQWWRSSQYNGPHDIHMCAYTSLLQAVSGFHDVVYSDAQSEKGAKKKLDLQLVQWYVDQIITIEKAWKDLLDDNFVERPSPLLMCRDSLWPFLASYAKLVVLSIGLQHGLRQGLKHDNPFSDQCIDAASDVLRYITENMAKLGYLRCCVEAHFLFAGFAAAFLLKILRPKFSFMMEEGREQEIIRLVQRLVDVFGSDEVAIDDRHTPKLYSRFLSGVLTKHMHARSLRDPKVQHPTSPVARRQDSSSSVISPSAQFGQPSPGGSLWSSVSTPLDQPWLHDTFSSFSPYMDVDKPFVTGGQVQQEDITLMSMTAIADPRFWEQGTMPGFSWMTGAQPLPIAVDKDNLAPAHPPLLPNPSALYEKVSEPIEDVFRAWESSQPHIGSSNSWTTPLSTQNGDQTTLQPNYSIHLHRESPFIRMEEASHLRPPEAMPAGADILETSNLPY